MKLPEFNAFVAARDLVVYLNPARLSNSEGANEVLYFWRDLDGGETPDYALWHFLIKAVIYDSVGRTPRGLKSYAEEDITSEEYTTSDWNGISAFWYPGAIFTAFTITSGNNWVVLYNKAKAMNLSRTVPLYVWKPT